MSQPLILGGRTIWIADAHRDDGKRFVVHADEKLTAWRPEALPGREQPIPVEQTHKAEVTEG